MRPGRELDTQIAEEVFGFKVKVKQKELWEEVPLGDRPLRRYSKEISAAWEVVEKMGITLIPIQGGTWFAFIGDNDRWKSPAEFIKYLQSGNFMHSGAAVDSEAPLTICLAALKAVAARKMVDLESSNVDTLASHGTSMNGEATQHH